MHCLDQANVPVRVMSALRAELSDHSFEVDDIDDGFAVTDTFPE